MTKNKSRPILYQVSWNLSNGDVWVSKPNEPNNGSGNYIKMTARNREVDLLVANEMLEMSIQLYI